MNCKIIQDLLPLYRDEVCSQESRQAVDEHIQSCPHCAEVLREMGREENLDRETADVDREKAQVIAGVKRRFSRRKRLSVLATAAAMLAMFLVFTAAADVERPVPYQDGMVEASLASDGVIDIYYYGGNYASFRVLDREIDGRTAVYLCYTQNIKSNLTPLFSHAGRPESSGHLSIGNGLLLDTVKGAAVQIPSQDEIQEVYYLAGDYAALEDMGEAEFSAATDGAVLLWQRS